MSLTARYTGVLLFIALLTGLIFWISYSVTLEQQKDGELINVSGQQRTLTMAVESLGFQVLRETDAEARLVLQDQLSSVLEELERTHLILAYGDLGNGKSLPTSDKVQTLFFGTNSNLALYLRQYIEHGFALTLLDESGAARYDQDLKAIQSMHSKLDAGLDEVVLAYQTETDQKIAKLKAIQQAGLFATIAVLFVSAVSVFRPMVQKIRSSFEDMRVLHEKLGIRNVELEMAKDKFEKQAVELVAMTENLVDARDAAEQAQKAMGVFMSSMSHELRTPLNAILGFSQLMEYDKNTPLNETQQESVDIIKQSGDHLLTLINELLDLSKIESGTFAVSDEVVAPRAVINECHKLVEMQAAGAGITVIDETQGRELPPVRGDGLRVKQALLNFLSNAIKYNRENGQVTINCVPEGTEIKFSVEDTGKGLTDAQMEVLFEPYSRVGAEKTLIEGTGLGLTITKKLVEMMGGRIGVESKLGQGSVFWFTLPAALSDEAAS